MTIMDITQKNIDNIIDLLSNINYKDFEDIEDLKDFHNKIWAEIQIINITNQKAQERINDEKIDKFWI